MVDDVLNILFVCPGNAGCSLFCEALLNKLGRGKFMAYSAGYKPIGHVNAFVLETLQQAGYDISALRSKNWAEFATIQAPRIDAVLTLNDEVKKQRYPIWYSNPVLVHWQFREPDIHMKDDQECRAKYRRLFGDMEQQILKLMGLDIKGLDRERLESKLKSIAPN